LLGARNRCIGASIELHKISEARSHRISLVRAGRRKGELPSSCGSPARARHLPAAGDRAAPVRAAPVWINGRDSLNAQPGRLGCAPFPFSLAADAAFEIFRLWSQLSCTERRCSSLFESSREMSLPHHQQYLRPGSSEYMGELSFSHRKWNREPSCRGTGLPFDRIDR
jgi:hypothetical protein